MREIRTSGVTRGEPAIVHGMRVLSHNRGNPETDVDRSLNTLAGSPTLQNVAKRVARRVEFDVEKHVENRVENRAALRASGSVASPGARTGEGGELGSLPSLQTM